VRLAVRGVAQQVRAAAVSKNNIKENRKNQYEKWENPMKPYEKRTRLLGSWDTR
jgi:hypothetical protein